MTKQEIDTLVEGFPEYYRLSIHLALLVGGLRIGEVCGLQLRDIDLDHRLLYVRHSVTQGPDDLGEYRLDETRPRKATESYPSPHRSAVSSGNISTGSVPTGIPTRCSSTRSGTRNGS